MTVLAAGKMTKREVRRRDDEACEAFNERLREAHVGLSVTLKSPSLTAAAVALLAALLAEFKAREYDGQPLTCPACAMRIPTAGSGWMHQHAEACRPLRFVVSAALRAAAAKACTCLTTDGTHAETCASVRG